jgi:hypothetical protein
MDQARHKEHGQDGQERRVSQNSRMSACSVAGAAKTGK